MKPILYERTYAGGTDTLLGTLADAVSCTVTEQRNGEYELEMEYLPTGVLANSIKTGAVILATPHYGGEYQPFRIYNVEKTLTGTMAVSAHHISYDLTKVYLKYFNDTTGITATLAAIKSNLIQQSGDTTDWTFANDGIENETSTFSHPEPTTVRAALGGVEGSLLDTFGGEFEWDGFNVIVHKNRGEDRGVHIRYAGNLLEFTRAEDFENAYSHVMVYWFDEETGSKTTSLSYPVHDLVASDFTQSRTAVINVTDQYETQPNRATLNPVAQAYANKLTSKPTIGLEVKFVDLNSTTEGGAEAPVLLCDTLHVIDPVRDVSISAKVIETKWNVLLDRYDEVTVGTKGKNIADTISGLSASGGSAYSGSGGGGGGSTETDYRNLSNLPQINGVELVGNKSLSALGIASETALAAVKTTADGAIQDVKVNGTSVKSGTTANVTVPTKTSDIANDSGFITAEDIPAAPVTSVNGQTGAVNLAIPDSTSDLTNDSGFITASGAPVQSVNGQTGNVSLDVPTIHQVLASGTEIARVFANSGDQTGTPIYAPAGGGGGGSYSQKLWTGICTTAADVQTKEVTLDDPTGFSLTAGVFILIRFTLGNTKTFPKLTLGGETKNLVSTTVNQNTFSGQTPYHTIDDNQPILAVYNGTAWIFDNAYRNKANLWDPALSGVPTAPTAAAGTNTRQLATTAFVQAAIAGLGGSGKAYIGTCDTAQGVPTKVVACSDFVLETGAVIYVKFTNAHVISALSLNVNDTGAVTVTNAGESGGMGALWKAGAVVEFVYDGTAWVMMGHVKATTSYPGIVALSNSTTSNSETAAATPKAVKAAFDNGGVQSVTPDYTSGVKVATFATSGGTVDLYLPVWNGSVSS